MIDQPTRKEAFGVVFAALTCVILVGTAADRRSPIDITGGEADQEVFAREQAFEGTWHVTILRFCSGKSRRWLQSLSEPTWYLPLEPLDLDLSHITNEVPKSVMYAMTPFIIPDKAPLGPMTYHNVTTFKCNWLGHELFPITTIFPAILFNVGPKL